MATVNSRKRVWSESITALVRRLPPKKQELIRPVLEAPREHVLLSLRNMAESLDSAPATLLRTIRELGFPGYRDFRQYLHDLALSHATSLEEMAGNPREFGPASLNQDARNLQALRHTMDMDRVLTVVKRIYKAERILVISGDMAANLAGLLNYQVSLLGLNCASAVAAGEIFHRTRHLGRRDLVIAISFRRGLRQTVEGMKMARARGAYCLGITDTSVSPIARYANEFFITPTDGVSFAWSYVAPVAFINVLMVACANYRRARSVEILRESAKEQRNGFRWYPEEA